MQTKKKHSKRFTRTKRSSSTRNKLKRNQTGGTRSEIYVETAPGNWQPAFWYQKTAFKKFVPQYTRGLNLNPDNVYQYDTDGIKFQVLGEIYIVRENGSRMRIKRVQLPEGTPDPDFEEEEEPVGTDNKYYFNAINGDNYFNNTINKEIETKKRTHRNFAVGNDRYNVVLDQQETQVPNKPRVKIGTLYAQGYSYPLYYRFTSGWSSNSHSGY